MTQGRDTIAAIATAIGRGGIGVIRLSGTKLLQFAEALSGKQPEPRRASLADFHSADDADAAAAVFNAVVRRKEVPADIPAVPLPEGVRAANGIRLDKLLAKIGLADSVSDAARKIKAGAVEINGEKVKDLALPSPAAELVIQAGKNWRKVTL